MTGIERLREFAKGCRLTGQRAYSNAIGDIADQIAREHAEDCQRMGLDYGAVSRVVSDMERHVLGHEGMEDSPVARWARELREALGATMSRQEGDAVAGSPRDSLSDEEVEDVATVRKDAYDAYEWVSGHGGLETVGARLMPEGCEWPRYESGEPVRIGDAIVDELGHAHEVSSVEVFDDAEALHWIPSEPEDFVWLVHGERAKRPAPRVLDADGVEILVGDTVFNERGDKFTVSKVDHERGVFSATAAFDGREGIGFSPIYFSHEHKLRPEIDSWERITEDIASPYCADYCIKYGVDHSSMSFEYAKACDIVRRAKALAERDR